MKNNSTWDNMIKPVVVLFSICFVVSALLAVTNSVTAPIIAANSLKAEQESLLELLPEATSFTEIEGVEMDNVEKVYSSDNGVGYVVTCAAKGYGGDVEWMCAFDNEGTIVGAKVLSESETAGLGAKCEEEWFQTQFIGHSEELELNANGIDQISGATITSKATIKALNAARNAFSKYALGVEVTTAGPEVTVAGNTYSVTEAGFMDADTVITATVENGTITAVTVDESANGSKIMTDDQVKTLTDAVIAANSADVDGVSGATFTSDAVKAGIKDILNAIANGTAVEGEIAAVEETVEEEVEEVEEVAEEIEGGVTGTGAGFGGEDSITVTLTFNDDGSIATCTITADKETPAIGGSAVDELAEQVVAANSAEIDGVSGATLTSNGVREAVAAALANK